MNRSTPLQEAALFFALTLGASFLLFWGPIALFKIPTISFVSDVRGPGWAIAMFITGGFVPSLAALFLTGLKEGKAGLGRLLRRTFQVRIGWQGYLAAISLITLITLGQVILLRLFGQRLDSSLFIAQLGSFLPLLIIGPLSEELGWRGYAQDRLQTRWNPLAASLIIGAVWSVWHLPLFFMVGTSQHELGIPFTSFFLSTTISAVLYGWLYNRTGRSVWSAVLLHWLYTYAAQVIATGAERTPLYNWLEFVPVLVVALVVVAIWKPGREVQREYSS